ncbi:hypothetical protein [Actinomadura sp. 6N118]|uniref:hypothetical protein n=1 Tax=Actinomadura sp. 6N118 TaxID=3375151 RepID=UPI0037B1B391
MAVAEVLVAVIGAAAAGIGWGEALERFVVTNSAIGLSFAIAGVLVSFSRAWSPKISGTPVPFPILMIRAWAAGSSHRTGAYSARVYITLPCGVVCIGDGCTRSRTQPPVVNSVGCLFAGGFGFSSVRTARTKPMTASPPTISRTARAAPSRRVPHPAGAGPRGGGGPGE